MFSSYNWDCVKRVRLPVQKGTPLFTMFSSVKASLFTVLHTLWLLGPDSTQSSSTDTEQLVQFRSNQSLYMQVKIESIILSWSVSRTYIHLNSPVLLELQQLFVSFWRHLHDLLSDSASGGWTLVPQCGIWRLKGFGYSSKSCCSSYSADLSGLFGGIWLCLTSCSAWSLPRGSYLPTLQDPEVLVDLLQSCQPNTGSKRVWFLNGNSHQAKLNIYTML